MTDQTQRCGCEVILDQAALWRDGEEQYIIKKCDICKAALADAEKLREGVKTNQAWHKMCAENVAKTDGASRAYWEGRAEGHKLALESLGVPPEER